jgi:hypothetical protein
MGELKRLIPEVIERRILLIRGQKVMLDAHLADLSSRSQRSRWERNGAKFYFA